MIAALRFVALLWVIGLGGFFAWVGEPAFALICAGLVALILWDEDW